MLTLEAVGTFHFTENTAIRDRAINVYVEGADVAEFRVGGVENLFIGRKSQAIGLNEVRRDQGERLAVGRYAKYSLETPILCSSGFTP